MRLGLLPVDDDPTLVDLLSDIFLHEGFAVSSARDGDQAVTLARAEHPDVMILDACLPGLDGFTVCARLRAAAGCDSGALVSGFEGA